MYVQADLKLISLFEAIISISRSGVWVAGGKFDFCVCAFSEDLDFMKSDKAVVCVPFPRMAWIGREEWQQI